VSGTSAPIGPYVPAGRAAGLLFCSGQLGVRDGVLVGDDVAQLVQAIENLKGVLAAHGAGLGDVVKTTLFVTDLSRFTELNAAYVRGFGSYRPARTTVQVAALPLGAAVELEAIAHVSAAP
jgi:2-iminobutanoate/2-iminopropanoate deaminase